jgi:hypothetical protein
VEEAALGVKWNMKIGGFGRGGFHVLIIFYAEMKWVILVL